MLFHLNIIFCLQAHKILHNIWETVSEYTGKSTYSYEKIMHSSSV